MQPPQTPPPQGGALAANRPAQRQAQGQQLHTSWFCLGFGPPRAGPRGGSGCWRPPPDVLGDFVAGEGGDPSPGPPPPTSPRAPRVVPDRALEAWPQSPGLDWGE